MAKLPDIDRPEAFSQHPNAEISYLKEDMKTLLDNLLSLQPKITNINGNDQNNSIMNIINNIMDKIPETMDLAIIIKNKSHDLSPLHIVLFQEIER